MNSKLMSKIINSGSSEVDSESSVFVTSSTDEFNIFTILHIIIISVAIVHVIYLILMLIKLNCFSDDKHNEQTKALKKINDTCTICLDELQNEVQLLCSHSYCAKCIILYAKQRFSFVNVKCPYCRVKSKLLIPKFEKTAETMDDYEEIVKYNHQLTSNMKTSLCFCIDTFRFFMFYSRQILDFNNPTYSGERCCFFSLIIIVLIVMVFPLLGDVSDWIVIIEDFVLYTGLVCIFAEMFYTRIRRRTNREFDLQQIESERQSRLSNPHNVENNQNNVEMQQQNNPENDVENQVNVEAHIEVDHVEQIPEA